MDKLSRFRKLYELKRVYRRNSVGKRKESSAEHTWSAMMLADFFLSRMKKKIDRLKVYELLLYHDLVEIEAGDIPLHHEKERKAKKKNEAKAMEKLKGEIPQGGKFKTLFREFEAGKTIEARFTRAMDRLDAVIHEVDNKHEWKGWSEGMVRRLHEPAFKGLPEVEEFFEEIMAFLKQNGYFSQ